MRKEQTIVSEMLKHPFPDILNGVVTERTVCSRPHRAASTTQKALSVRSVAPATLVTQAEVAPMTASHVLARTWRAHVGKANINNKRWALMHSAH